MDRRRIGAAAVIGALALGVSGCTTDLEVGTSSRALAVSTTGWIAGNVVDDTGARAFARTPHGSLITFGNPADEPAAVNDAGTVVGTNSTGSPRGPNATAWRWTASGGLVALHDLGSNISAATDINDAGVVVGGIVLANLGTVPRSGPVVWTSPTGEPTWLPPLPDAGLPSIATGINESGDIGGRVYAADGTAHAVWWDASDGYALHVLDTNGATSVGEVVIADDGTVAASLDFGDDSWAGAVWAPGATTYTTLAAPGRITVGDICGDGNIVGSVELDGHARAARWGAATRAYVDLGGLDGPESWVVAADHGGAMAGVATRADGTARAARFEG